MPCVFDSLPNRTATKLTMHGLSFNVMVVGPTGIGKTTLINSLFDFDYGDCPDHSRENTNVAFRVKDFQPPNRTIKMQLTIIETKGFDNQLDKSRAYKPIVEYITNRYEEFLNDDSKIRSASYNFFNDSRVHCCIYMIPPIGPGLRPIDVVTMKQLHKKVCLIPVIAKADMLTQHEKHVYKEKIKQDIQTHGIEIYPSDEYALPLAIAASNDIITVNGKQERVRSYPWGKMFIEQNSEFPQLRDLVLRGNMLSLIEYTNRVHYENYRREVTSGKKSSNVFLALDELHDEEKSQLLRDIEKLEKQRYNSPRKGAHLSKVFSSPKVS